MAKPIKNSERRRLVALAGYAGAGKDEAAKGLFAYGFVRHNFGDIIKSQLDALIVSLLGFSAFTEDRGKKERVRGLLEQWGEANYANIFQEFFQTLPADAVNTRLVRTNEADKWKTLGGVIIYVSRPGINAATQWEADRVRELFAGHFIDGIITNEGTIDDLQKKLAAMLEDRGLLP